MPTKTPRLDPRLAQRLTHKKARLDSQRPLSSDVLRHLHELLRVTLTYHSNAIEGNTLSLRETQMVIEYGATIHGHPLREYLEATNHAEAYDYLTSIADQSRPMTSETILTLHQLVTMKILDSAGSFRTVPVFIRGSNMTPPPARDVPDLMRQWVAWIAGEGMTYEPLLRAAIAHHGFEAVHPFVDGNGRVGRLLLNLMLMRDGYPPALLLRDWRVRYIHALDVGNTGNYGPLANLIGQAVESGLDLYLEACSAAPDDDFRSLSELAPQVGLSVEHVGWLIRKGRLDGVKRGRNWYTTLARIQHYQREVAEGVYPKGRPAKKEE